MGSPPSAAMSDNKTMAMGGSHKMASMHMTFFWGSNAQILFSGWPGSRTGMYGLALLSIFAASVAVEWLAHRHHVMVMAVVRPRGYATDSNGVNVNAVSHHGLAAHALVHALRAFLSYAAMLAVMSFNAGVFLAAVAGRAVGFLVFRSDVFGKRGSDMPPYERASSGF